MKEFDTIRIEQAWETILSSLGINYLEDPNFTQTPHRIAEMYKEIFGGLLDADLEELENHLTKTFPCSYDQMIVEKGIEVWGMCPHHFLPVHYFVDVGYLPSQQVLGLSKLPRVIQVLARRPVLQEQFTQDIVDYIERVLNPRGVIVKVGGLHLCMHMRGCKSHDTKSFTSALTGAFHDFPSLKSEFLSFVN